MRCKGKGWIITGLLLIATALLITSYNLWEQYRAGDDAAQIVSELEQQLPAVADPLPDYLLTPEMEMPVNTINGVNYIGVLYIPTLKLELPVISQWSYPALKCAPCRYSGSAYLDNFVICAHNYVSHFGRLKSLHIGDTVTFTDVDGNLFVYAIADVELLASTSVEEMENSDWPLTLFTCTMGGQSRIAVRCERLEASA